MFAPKNNEAKINVHKNPAAPARAALHRKPAIKNRIRRIGERARMSCKAWVCFYVVFRMVLS